MLGKNADSKETSVLTSLSRVLSSVLAGKTFQKLLKIKINLKIFRSKIHPVQHADLRLVFKATE